MPSGCKTPRKKFMQRFTICLDKALAAQFDALIAAKGYVTTSTPTSALTPTPTRQATGI